jgi:tetratricopeptide (TPR) repeat protein
MVRNIVILALLPIVGAGLLQRASARDDFEDTLTRAQALYYEARFKDSVELLLPVDEQLRQQPGHVSESIRVKLQLALGYIGQNQTGQAKSVFQEVCVLDASYSLDSSQFAPKVLALFDDAKAEQKRAHCEVRCGEIDKYSRSGDVQGLLRLAGEPAEGCTCEAAAGAAELLYTQGVEAYRREDFAQAVEKLRAALKFRPQHDLAVQYAELAESKAKFIVEQKLLDWRKHFEAQEFPQAATLYRQLESVNFGGKADTALGQMRGEYRKVVSSRVESWNQSCSTSASQSLDTFRQQTRDLLPNEAIAADLISKSTPCEPEVTVPVAKVEAFNASTAAAPTSASPAPLCLEMQAQQAMARIKSQIIPTIPPERMPSTPVNFRVKVRIDETGSVSVTEIAGSNSYLNQAMRVAIERWKFVPAVVQDQRRCVETELPVVLKR